MLKSDFLWFQNWNSIAFTTLANSDKLHLETLDNPGWELTVNLQDTKFEVQDSPIIEINRAEND